MFKKLYKKHRAKLIIALLLAALAYYLAKYVNGFNIVVYGNVDIKDVNLSFRVPGKIKALYYDEGDEVESGQILAALDPEPFEIDLALSQAELAEADANLMAAEKEYKRQQNLFNKQINSSKDLDYALEVYNKAIAKKDATQAGLNQALLRLKDTKLTAPSKGIIINRIREKGSVVSEGAPIYGLLLESPVYIRAYIDEVNLGNIHNGQEVVIKNDSGSKYQGKIGFISPQAEFTPKTVQTEELRTSLVYRLRIIVQNPDNKLRQGMPVTVNISNG